MVQPCPFAGDRDPEARKGRGPLDDRGVEGWSGVGDLGTSEAKACFHFSVFSRSAGSAAPPKNLSLNHQNNHQGLCLIRHPLALADKCLHT
jgi:hypothetical protein